MGKAEEVLPREFEEKQIYADVIVVTRLGRAATRFVWIR